MPAKVIAEMTVEEVRKGLKKTQTVVIPIGITEQHGYHLPLATDTIIAEEFARRAACVCHCFLAPSVNYNFSGGTLSGTINISPPVISLLVMEICHSFSQQGFRNLIFLAGHGGSESIQAITAGLDFWQRKNLHLPIKIAFLKGWLLTDWQKKAFQEKDFHAGYIETSLLLYLKPNLVRKKIKTDTKKIMKMLAQNPDNYQMRKKLLDDENIIPKIIQHPQIKIGVMGNPFQARRKIGEEITRQAVKKICEVIRKMEGKR